MNNKTDIDVQYVSPLKKICMTIGELPASYLETMSYYEMLIWFTEFLKNTVIPTVNNNAEAVEELQALYEELRTYVNNYFDSQDWQSMVNNKLDEMLEDGVLEQIIEQYLNSKAVFCFDTIADLKASTNLIDGSEVRVLGNTNYNDGVNQLFLVTTATGDEVDGANDTIVINEDLVAKRIKVKDNLPLKPNITSDEEIKNLHIVNESTSSGTAGISFDGQSNVTVSHSNIEGGYWSAKVGNENDSNNTTKIKLINNKLKSAYGVSLRHKSGQTDGGEHIVAFNDIENTANHPGVESWAKEDMILFNRIKNISGSVGGTGGITLGSKPNQIAMGNYIKNYAYGVELGNSNLDIVSNCFIDNCTTGIVCSSDNTHEAIIKDCIIKVPTDGNGIYLRSGERVNIDNCIIIHGDTLGDPNTASTRSGRGFYSDTYAKEIIITNSVFINLSSLAIAPNTHVTNCKFYNISNINMSGNVHFSNCLFKDVNNIGITGVSGYKQYFDSCNFIRSTTNTSMNEYLVNAHLGTNVGIAVFNNCTKSNCEYNSMVSNATAGERDIRFLAQEIDGIYYTYNRAQLSNIKTAFTAMGYSVNAGDKIIDRYNNKVWNVLTLDKHISYQGAVPTTGAFVKGDRIYNNFYSSTTVDYWLCTVTGEFGTDTEPVFTAHNI